MTTIIEVSEKKVECMSECVENILHYGGKMMRLLEEIEDGGYDMKHSKKKEEDEDYYEPRVRRSMKPEYPRYY